MVASDEAEIKAALGAYSSVADRLADTLLSLGHGNRAVEVLTTAQTTAGKHAGRESVTYANAVNRLARTLLVVDRQNRGKRDHGNSSGSSSSNSSSSSSSSSSSGGGGGGGGGAISADADDGEDGEAAVDYCEQAVELHQTALDILEVTVGSDHPSYVATLNNMAAALEAAGSRAEAMVLHYRVKDIQEATLGRGDLPYATTAANIASLLYQEERYEEALPLYHEALGIRVGRLGPDHADTAKVQWNLYTVYDALGRPDEAAEYVKQALLSFRATLGDGHALVRRATAALAECGGYSSDVHMS